MESFRRQMAKIMTPNEDFLVIDSMPLEVCKLSGSSRVKVCKLNFDTALDKVIKDKNAEINIDLFNHQDITIESSWRSNQKHITQAFVFFKYRKRIETIFSQMCVQFLI